MLARQLAQGSELILRQRLDRLDVVEGALRQGSHIHAVQRVVAVSAAAHCIARFVVPAARATATSAAGSTFAVGGLHSLSVPSVSCSHNFPPKRLIQHRRQQRGQLGLVRITRNQTLPTSVSAPATPAGRGRVIGRRPCRDGAHADDTARDRSRSQSALRARGSA